MSDDQGQELPGESDRVLVFGVVGELFVVSQARGPFVFVIFLGRAG